MRSDRRIVASAVLAIGCSATAASLGHIIRYDFVLQPTQVVPAASGAAWGAGHIFYNHHTGEFTIDVTVWGIHTADLLGVGPNSVPAYICVGDKGVNGDPIVDFSIFDPTPWEDTPAGMHMNLPIAFLGGDQGNLSSDFSTNDDAIQSFRTYIQIFTRAFPAGELRGQIVERPGLPCLADRDGDGFVTGDDYDLYVQLFEVGDSLADFDDDGFVTGDDFDAFVTAFELGC